MPGQFSLDPSSSPGEGVIFDFLNAQSPKSVILISFGTFFYPVLVGAAPLLLGEVRSTKSMAFQTPHYVTTLLKVLLKTSTPFIISRASQAFSAASLPQEVEEEMKERKLGLIVDFIPQQEVLAHPNMGAFVTHGGASSMWESIMAGVIGIYWPMVADQPMHAAYLTTKVSHVWIEQ